MAVVNVYPQDGLSGNIKTIDPVHCMIHDGVHFTASHQVTIGTATAATVLFQTPASSQSMTIHFVCGVEADKEVTWTLSEAPNASGGSALVSYNNNRKSDITSPATLTHTPTYVSSGTVLESHVAGSGTGSPASSKVGGESENRNEWDLKNDTLYLIRVAALNATTIVNIVIPYYYRTV